MFFVHSNAFVPPDQHTGYTVRVDTPAVPAEAPLPMYPEVATPPRAATPQGKANAKKKGIIKG
jgi:hypothetical protein